MKRQRTKAPELPKVKEEATKPLTITAVLLTDIDTNPHFISVTRITKGWIFYKEPGNEHWEGKINRKTNRTVRVDSWSDCSKLDDLDFCLINNWLKSKSLETWDGGWRPKR